MSPADSPAPKPRNQHLLTYAILCAMILGILVGLLINIFAGDVEWISTYLSQGAFQVVGGMFMRLLKMLVVPLVFVSIVCGIIALQDIRKLGRMSLKALALYIATTAIAISLALAVASVVKPGSSVPDDPNAVYEGHASKPLAQVLTEIVPDNPVQAMATAEMLQVIVFSVFVAVAIVQVGERAAPVKAFFESLNDVVMRMVWIVMIFAPLGVFGLVAKTFATMGLEGIVPLAKYFFTVLGVLLIHAAVTYSGLLVLLGRLNPLPFFAKMWRVQLNAFATASSGATIPLTLETSEHRLGVKNSVAAFTVPLGATINMDGTAIMQGVATVFVANYVGVDLTLIQCVIVVLMATMASIGTAAIPSVGLVTLGAVLTQVGLPLEPIAFIVGVDRLLDMTRTAVNVTGDATVTCIVAKGEGDLDEALFRKMDA
ncbi:MAG: dicarboxylate/amino acid:cation symporter [Verrucomicrobiota bacterium JB022]|nr:dicarboxylate/amino acid:cation symporter [Verrucomicrobiota bacterium JB022]